MRLLRDGEEVPLPPQPFKLLLYLVENSGKTVTREELRTHVWGDSVVEFETGLNFGVRQVREALGDTGTAQQYIKTIRGTGYRFVAPVEKTSEVASNRWKTLIWLGPVLVAAAAVFIVGLSRPSPVTNISFEITDIRQEGLTLHPNMTNALRDVVAGRLIRESRSLGVPVGLRTPGGSFVTGARFVVEPEVWVKHASGDDIEFGYRFVATRLVDSATILGRSVVDKFESVEILQAQVAEGGVQFLSEIAAADRDRRRGRDLRPVGVQVADVDNTGTAEDLQVSCTQGIHGSDAEEFRAMISPVSSAQSFDLARAAGVSVEHYTVMSPGTHCASTRMSRDMLDVDGDPITTGKPYQAFVLAIAGEEMALSHGSAPLELLDRPGVRTLVPHIVASGGLFMDAAGFLYIGDWGPGSQAPSGTNLFRIDPETGDVELVSHQMQGFSSGVAMGDDIYVTNFGAGTVVHIDASGNHRVLAQNLLGPTGIVDSENGDLLVSQCSGSSIARIDSLGTVSTFAVDPLFTCPDGLTLDPEGNLFSCNFNSGGIIKTDPQGQVTFFATVPGGTCAKMDYFGGSLFVTALRANQVFRIEMNGEVTLLAGTGERRQVDGNFDRASFGRPNGIVVDGQRGVMYVGDSRVVRGNVANPNSIRIVDLPADLEAEPTRR